MEYSYTQTWAGATVTITYPDKVIYHTAFDVTFSVDSSTLDDYDAIAFLTTLGISQTVDLSQATWGYTFVSADTGWNYTYTGTLGDSTTPWSATETQYVVNFADPNEYTSPYTWLWGYWDDKVTWSVNGMIIEGDTSFTLFLDDSEILEGPIAPTIIVLDPPPPGGEEPPPETIYASSDFTLPAGVKNLVLEGTGDFSGTGNALDNAVTGNAGANALAGLEGDDTLNGAAGDDQLDGGSGIDVMAGGVGDDTYVVDSVGDAVVEATDEGVDSVVASVSYALPGGVEHLALSGTADLAATGNVLDNVLSGNGGANALYGDAGADVLNGGGGNDQVVGGAGDDAYVYNVGDGLDKLFDSEGIDELRLGAALSLDNLAIRVRSSASGEVAQLRVLDASGSEQADQGIDFAVTRDAAGNYVSPVEVFRFADGSVRSFDDLRIKTQVVESTSKNRHLTTGRDDDIITTGPGANVIHAGTGNDIVYSRSNGDVVHGEGGNDFLLGGNGNDVLDGGTGIDVLQGGNGNDTLRQQGGKGALLGGIGRDSLSGGSGDDFIAGGQHDDTIVTGVGHNVVAFNRNDRNDTVEATAGAVNTLSLGGGIISGDLSFSVRGTDLVLSARHNDSITFKDWFADQANRTFVTLQLVDEPTINRSSECCGSLPAFSINTYDFSALVRQFDEARAADAKLDRWSLMNGLLDAHLEGSNGAALGGDLAYNYGTYGDLRGVTLSTAQQTLSDPGFGRQAQGTFPPLPAESALRLG